MNATQELREVEKILKRDFTSEKIISNLYGHIFNSNGKKIRAKLNLISSYGTKSKNRYLLAAVIELLHTATLVHDDVVDDSPERRGKKSVNSMWSNAHGVLIGDYIYSKAFIHMVNIKNIGILEELSSATNDISQGELMQLDALGNLDVTLDKLKKISYFKTGRLFEASARTGGILSKISVKQLNYLGDCAKNLGILFQIRDDLLDYSIDKRIGKPNFQDLQEGKITYPFYYAYKKANLTQKKELKTALGKKTINQKKILTMIIKLNGIKKTKELASKYRKEAILVAKKLDNLKIQKEMIELIDQSLNRKK